MDLESRKYKFIEKLLKVEEEDTLYKLESVLDNESSNIIWDELPSELRQALEISIAQSERGEVSPHKEVMTRIKNKYNLPDGF